MAVVYRLLDLGMRETWTNFFRQIGQLEAERRGLGYVFLELRKVYFVISIGDRMVVHEIICLFLISDESWDTLEHEIEMIGSPIHVGGEFCGVELGERR